MLSLVQAGRGNAQDSKVLPGLGSVEGTTLQGLNPTEFVLDAPASRVAAIALRHDLTIIRTLDARSHTVYLVRGPSYLTDDELVTELESDPEVTHFELNAIAFTPEVPSGLHLDQSPVYILDALANRTLTDYYGTQTWTGYTSQPGTAAIRLADAQRDYATGTGIVAIIDTGVDPNHPLLSGSLVPGYDFVSDTAGSGSEWGDIDPATAAVLDQSPVYILDQTTTTTSLNQSTIVAVSEATAQSLSTVTLPAAFGHGTMVAGLVHLVAPTAKIMPLKAFRADGSSRVFDIVRAIHYAVDNGAKVINMSFSTAELSPEITHAIDYATERGVICVSSAGNSGKQVLVYPAALRNVVGIGSTTSTSPPARSTFTNYGDSLVRLGAPGQGLITTYPGGHYAAAWGTSFSTALVSGTAALLLQVDPAIDPWTASDFLGKADKMLLMGMGRGRLNIYNALRQLRDAIAAGGE